MEISGKIIAVLPIQQGTSKGSGKQWSKQDFVIETQEQYPKKMCYQIFGEEKIKMHGAQVGDDVDVSFDIDCKEWNGKWFNSVNAWKVIQRNVHQTSEQSANQQYETPKEYQQSTFENDKGKDDLPF